MRGGQWSPGSQLSPGALGLLVVRPDDDPLDGDAHPVLALAPVTAEPDLIRKEENHGNMCY